MNTYSHSLNELVDLVHVLLSEGGCAWDRSQTHTTLVRYLLEETYELIEAIEHGSVEDLQEELGDVLYQVLFHAEIAAQSQHEGFNIFDVASRVEQKMRSRHPHVFVDPHQHNKDDVVEIWEKQKHQEKSHRTCVFDGIPAQLPALLRGQKMVERAQRMKDSPSHGGVMFSESACPTQDELGNIFLEGLAYAASQGWDAEQALHQALDQFASVVHASEPECMKE